MNKATLVCIACAATLAALMIGDGASAQKAVTPPVLEKPVVEKPAADKLVAEKPAAEKPVVEIPDPSLTPSEITEREQEYLAALKKCEPMQERARQDCIRAVKARYGLM